MYSQVLYYWLYIRPIFSPMIVYIHSLDVIPLNTVSDDWYRKLYSTIKDQQNMPVWVSEDKVRALMTSSVRTAL